MGPYGSPMASVPLSESDLRVTLTKIKKEIKVKHFQRPRRYYKTQNNQFVKEFEEVKGVGPRPREMCLRVCSTPHSLIEI